MTTKNIPPLKITEKEGDIYEIILDPNKHPVAYQRKIHDLIQSGMKKEEAEYCLMKNPIVMEIFYDLDTGLFAVESEACESCEIYNPYTGREIPNDNLSERDVEHMKQIDDSTCQLTEIRDNLQTLQGEMDNLTVEGEGVLESTIDYLDDALEQINKFTDPDDKKELFTDLNDEEE